MRTVNLIQGSEEWLAFRRTHITATDAAVIMDSNPYKNINELIAEKLHGLETTVNERMQRGKDLERIAMNTFENEIGGIYFPCVVLHEEYDWCMASLDGLEIAEEFQVEIKCPGKKNHSLAKKGIIPDEYYPQLQHQLACTGLNFTYYYSFDGENGIILRVERDNAYIDYMIQKEKEFYDYIKCEIV